MLIKTFGSAVFGVDATLITIEVNATRGAGFHLVGLPDNAVKESQQRILSSYLTSNFKWPGRRVIVNMAPADLRKEGSAYDLPLAIGILAADEQIRPTDLDKFVLMGELSLDGSLQPINGALPIAIEARKLGFKGFILPKANAREAAVVNNLEVYAADHISQVVSFFEGNENALDKIEVDTREEFAHKSHASDFDFSDVRGQENVKRALEIAASGSHNIIMVGAPGSGKTMLAKRIPTVLPPLTLLEALETTKIHSVAGKLDKDTSLMTQRPYQSPHHTISDVALVGGGAFPQPGSISLAHNGVLFLDELPEFKRTALEVMRQPLEDRKVTISRARFSVEFPANFMLVAAMNPCPCGFYTHPEKDCVCSPGVRQKYLTKISGPLLDRIDIHLEVIPVPFDKLSEASPGETSEKVRERVIAAREIQAERFKEHKGIYANSQMTSKMLRDFAPLDKSSSELLKNAMERLGLSARAYDRIVKVSRTIADLEGATNILPEHIAEAIQYRSLDRDGWAG